MIPGDTAADELARQWHPEFMAARARARAHYTPAGGGAPDAERLLLDMVKAAMRDARLRPPAQWHDKDGAVLWWAPDERTTLSVFLSPTRTD